MISLTILFYDILIAMEWPWIMMEQVIMDTCSVNLEDLLLVSIYVQVSLEVKNAFYTFRCSHINHHLK